ncbi:hypothetical protein D9M70_403470 [compost metagenome]
MRKLKRESRYEPAYEGELGELIEEVRFTPYAGGVWQRAGWLYLGTLGLNLGYEGGWYYAKGTPALFEAMQRHSIFEVKAETAHREHSLEVRRWGDGRVRLNMGFQQILGTYCLMEVGADEVEAMLERARGVIHAAS